MQSINSAYSTLTSSQIIRDALYWITRHFLQTCTHTNKHTHRQRQTDRDRYRESQREGEGEKDTQRGRERKSVLVGIGRVLEDRYSSSKQGSSTWYLGASPTSPETADTTPPGPLSSPLSLSHTSLPYFSTPLSLSPSLYLPPLSISFCIHISILLQLSLSLFLCHMCSLS